MRKVASVVVLVLLLLASFLIGTKSRDPLRNWIKAHPEIRAVRFALGLTTSTPKPSGNWHDARPNALPAVGLGPPGSDVPEQQLAQLDALGYLSGYEPPTTAGGASSSDISRAANGLNFYVSGHASEAVLMTMGGEVVHRWHTEFKTVFPDRDDMGDAAQWFRRAHLFENGDLLAVFPGWRGVDLTDAQDLGGLVLLDKDSNVRWSISQSYHHDVFVDEAGTIYGLVSDLRRIPELVPEGLLIDDSISVISPEGVERKRVSLIEALKRSSYASLLDGVNGRNDPLHANTIEVMDGSLEQISPIYRKGNVLVSLRTLNTIGIVDLAREQFVWALTGQWTHQHQPTVLADGHILLFDNLGNNGVSKVIEIDPFTQEIVWAYEGTKENGFFSAFSGSNQRLSNGNTLIVESNAGHAFEVTPQKELVWEFYNPARGGEHQEFIATMFDLVRLAPDFPTDWLPKQAEQPARSRL